MRVARLESVKINLRHPAFERKSPASARFGPPATVSILGQLVTSGIWTVAENTIS